MGLEDYLDTMPFLLEGLITLLKIGAIVSLLGAGGMMLIKIITSVSFGAALFRGAVRGFTGGLIGGNG